MDLILKSILGPICQRVIDAALEEYRLARGVKDEIRKLRRTVSMIKGVLEDAERKKVGNDAIHEWLKLLKQVLFDAEDVFDEIATDDEALGRRTRRRDAEDGTTRSAVITRRLSKVRSKLVSCLCTIPHICTRGAIAHRIKYINEEFDDISKLKDRLGLRVLDETSWSVIRPIRRQEEEEEETSLLPSGDTHIVGRGDEMRKIKELLLENFAEGTEATSGEKNVHVISVVGMGGIGKTTLVRHAYNNTEVGNYFQLRMWVCVSNYFDVKSVAIKIIEAAFDSEKAKELRECSNWDVVQNGLRDLIKGKRFLLVLDDVWEEGPSKWDRLYTPLSYGARGSKIIMTTRSQTVSNITKGTPIILKDLLSEDLWTILQNYAFDGRDPNTQLVGVGREIVKKLKGSPLAARTIGRVLNVNLDVMHWRNIASSEAWMSPNSEDNILPIIKLSYDHLPGHLKQCFALCSLFPEDHEFDKDELVQLWTAHQLIRIGDSVSHVESVGGVYLDKLVHMSLFEKTASPNNDTYVMHDLIHNLADSVSNDDCLRLEDSQQNGIISETIRHVSIASDRFDLSKIEQLCNKYKNMRTLLFLCGCKFQLDPHLHNIFMKLQRLRVLRLSRCGIEELPASIGVLKHLRFLDLSFNYFISKLPESLCNLCNLQVLNLQSCRGIRALPRNMSALVNLRHLIVSEYDYFLVSGIQGLGKLTALHELTFVCGGMQPMKELADMGMLRRLRIGGLREVRSREEAAGSRLDKKEHLDVLKLGWGDSDLIHPGLEDVLDSLQPPSCIRELSIDDYGGSRSPSWMEDQSWLRDSCFLRTLELHNCKNWEVLPPLGQLLCLDSLTISRMERVRRIGPAFMGCCRQLPQGGFPSLQVLKFDLMEEWEEWEAPRGTDADDGGEYDQVVFSEAPPLPLFLARLRELTIIFCPKLRQLPPLPPTLTKLHIEHVGLTHLPGWRLPPSSSLPCCCPSSSSSSPYSLCSWYIEGCPHLEGDDDGEDDQVFSEALLPPRRQLHRRPLFLARLCKLTIRDCRKLRQLPPLPPTLTKLKIDGVGLTHLPEWQLPPSSSSLPGCCSSSPCSLSSLVIRVCPELTSLAGGLLRHPLPNLVKLEIRNCDGLVSLLPETFFGHLPSLKELVVESYNKLAWPSTCESPSVEKEEETGLPPSLERITIIGFCDEVLDQMMLAIVGSRQKLACLTYLSIEGACFSRSPLRPTLRRSLPSSLQQLIIRDNHHLDDETLSAWLRGLTSLRQLDIRRCPALTSLPRAEVLSHLTALEKLSITRLEALESFGGGIHCLVSLEELFIHDWPELLDITTTTAADSSRPSSSSAALPSPARSSVGTSTTTRIRKLEIRGSSNMQQIKTWLLQCPSLQGLRIFECPQLTGFGGNNDVGGDQLEDALLNLSGTLQRLEFDGCHNLRSLPPRLRCLSSLQYLKIKHCPQIQSLPVEGLPESLRKLKIRRCLALEGSCKEGVGSDWPLISRIPRRSIWY